MKNIMWVVVLFSTTFWLGCKKDPKCNYAGTEVSAPPTEVEALEQYLQKDSIFAEKDSRGFYYTINAAGTSSKPNSCSDVVVNYKGTLTNGKVFDQSQSATFNLSGLIPGWQAGIPLIGKGGKITLYLPPSLGYGANQLAGIPANSILIFSIELINFQNP